MGTVETFINLMSLDLPFNICFFSLLSQFSWLSLHLWLRVCGWQCGNSRLSGVLGEVLSAPGGWDGGCMFLAGAFCQSKELPWHCNLLQVLIMDRCWRRLFLYYLIWLCGCFSSLDNYFVGWWWWWWLCTSFVVREQNRLAILFCFTFNIFQYLILVNRHSWSTSLKVFVTVFVEDTDLNFVAISFLVLVSNYECNADVLKWRRMRSCNAISSLSVW